MSEPTTLTGLRIRPRHQTLCPGTFCVGDRELDCEVLDISVGGAKVRLAEPVEVDTQVRLRIRRVGEFAGYVIWRNGTTLGVEFHEELCEVARIVEEMLSEDEDPAERRVYPRTSVLWAARLLCGAQVVGCRVLNVSAGGVKVRCDRLFKSDDDVVLKISRFGEFAGTVVWRQDVDLGIAFHDGPDHIIRVLGEAVPAIRQLPR